jgi:ABC-type lipoprotein release transport system permease subunit
LYLMVAEKRKDVGILKALGARSSQITKIFIRLGLIIGVTGLAIGTILGLLTCYLLAKYPLITLPDVYVDTRFPVLIDPKVIFGILVFSLIMTLISSFFPAQLAAAPSPTDILRDT